MKESEKKSRRSLLMLISLLLICIAGAVLVFWLSGRQAKDPASTPESTPSSITQTDQATQTIDPARQRYQFSLASSQTQEVPDGFTGYQTYFWLDGRLVRLAPAESENAYFDIRDAATGDVVQSIPYDTVVAAFANEDEAPAGVSLDTDGTLWLLTCNSDADYTLWQCNRNGASQTPVGTCQFLYPMCEDFAVWDQYVVMIGSTNSQFGNGLCIYNLENGSVETLDDVVSFCLDESGHLYYSNLKDTTLVCQDLSSGSIVWQQNANCQQLFLHPQYGLFTCTRGTGQINCLSTETGQTKYELFDWNEDSTLNYDDNRIFYANFAVDDSYQVYFIVNYTENSEPPLTWTLSYWIFAPYLPEDAAVTLTITAPYQVSALDSAIQAFQKLHPDVSVSWDVFFDSEEDFRTHVDQYSEQFSLRLMTGDVGDVLLLPGYGLDTSAVLDTDVLLGLDESLNGCAFLSDLNTDILDPLRDDSGTLRAVPLALNPPYLIYNKTLANSLGLDWDPQQLTWSQILDLGEQWYQDGEDLTLFGMMNTSYVDTLLSHMILVNLGEFQSAAGAETLAPLFETAKELISNNQTFYRMPDAQYWWSPGFWTNTLFTPGSNGADYENLFYNLSCAERDNNVELQLIPMPVGEDGTFRQSNADCAGISSRSEHADLAWEFLEYVLSEDGFVGDLYNASYALWNSAADLQRYGAVDDHGIPLEPEMYKEYRALCDLPVSRFTEPAGWIDAVWDPILAYFKDQRSLTDALDTAAENWSRQTVE